MVIHEETFLTTLDLRAGADELSVGLDVEPWNIEQATDARDGGSLNRCRQFFPCGSSWVQILNNHSVLTGPPFSATERFINNTANATTNVNTAAIQKVSK